MDSIDYAWNCFSITRGLPMDSIDYARYSKQIPLFQ